MMTRLTTIAYLGLLMLGCDDTPVDPVQPGTGGALGTGGVTGTTPIGLGGGGQQGTGGNSSSSGGASTAPPTQPSGTSCLVVPTADTGWVDGTANACKIQGAWYAYNDCNKSPTDCTTNQLPAVGATTGFPNVGGAMCTSGVTAAINAQYDLKWGAGIGLNLNQAAGSDVKGAISTLAVALKGFSFSLSGTTIPPTIRVNFPTAATEETAHFKTIENGVAGSYTVLFIEAAQGTWVTTPVALTAGDVNAIQFQVVGSDTATVAFDFCVEKLTGLY